MKPIINLSRNILILCLCLVALAGLHCRRRSDRASTHESKITILHNGDEYVLGPQWNEWARFLVSLPLVTPDEDLEPQGRLAQRWEHSPDCREWTFHLRQDVRWHDGVPVTAEDIKFSMELLSHPDVLRSDYWLDAKITARDDYTLAITFSKPTDALDHWWAVYYPKHLLEGLDTAKFYEWEFWTRPVGNGPYRYVRHIPKTMVELEANPDYYGGKPKIERVVLKFGGDPLIELMSGNVDVVHYLPPHEAVKIAKDPRFNMYHEFNLVKAHAIIWNRQNDFFRDPAIRRALTLAINRRELHQVRNFPEITPIFDVPITEGQFHRGELPEPLPYDPEQAKRLLDEAGWFEVEKNGIRENNGREFRFSLLVRQEQTLEAVYIQDQFRKVGVRMEVVTLDRSVLWPRRKSGEFDAILLNIHLFDYNKWNFGGHDNPEYKRLLEAWYRTAGTPDEKDIAVRKLWPIFRTDMPFTFLSPAVNFYVVHRRIRGLKSPNRSVPTGFMEHLWIEEEED
jgi:peptide/nickel transport system substrate-binding protein